jgi:hypothetical protein
MDEDHPIGIPTSIGEFGFGLSGYGHGFAAIRCQPPGNRQTCEIEFELERTYDSPRWRVVEVHAAVANWYEEIRGRNLTTKQILEASMAATKAVPLSIVKLARAAVRREVIPWLHDHEPEVLKDLREVHKSQTPALIKDLEWMVDGEGPPNDDLYILHETLKDMGIVAGALGSLAGYGDIDRLSIEAEAHLARARTTMAALSKALQAKQPEAAA